MKSVTVWWCARGHRVSDRLVTKDFKSAGLQYGYCKACQKQVVVTQRPATEKP